VNQIQNGQSPEFLKHLLAHPAAANLHHAEALQALVQTYPQCSVFHLLLAKAVQQSEAAMAAKALQSAAVHVASREVLFRLIHQPELIVRPKQETIYSSVPLLTKAETVNPDASFIDKNLVSKEDDDVDEIYSAENINAAFVDEILVAGEGDYAGENPSAENSDASFIDEKLATEESSAANTSFIDPNSEEAIVGENDLRVEDVNLTFINESAEEIVFPMEETIAQHQQAEETVSPIEVEPEPAAFAQEIDEEIYDEIIAIEDIKVEVVKTASPEENLPEAEPEITVEETPLLSVQDKAEKDMLSSIASIDYFTFNNRFGQNRTQSIEPQEPVTAPEVEADVDSETIVLTEENKPSAEKEPETVSKYHDDKMPYTFMWWLDKTRKEYAGTYQPYVKVVKPERTEQSGLSVGPELHQQYIESIFHTKAPHNLTETTLPPAIQPPVKRKEDQLIERFIIEEPHIHPPSNEKLDTENKAKKSSEDGDVLVTETLAKIYFDQMLYHKALDTYKKLVLKFPEKSRYFTAQIDLIEKKIN
jgi:hypothetical protein